MPCPYNRLVLVRDVWWRGRLADGLIALTSQ
jgi:hypothetical protein